jgi:hypothetical protein
MGMRCSAAALKRRVLKCAAAQSFLDPPLRAAARGLNGKRCSPALQRQGKNQEIAGFSCQISFKKIESQAVQSVFAAHFCAAAALVFLSYRCSAALQRLCFLALQRSGEAQRCGFQNLQRKVRSAAL